MLTAPELYLMHNFICTHPSFQLMRVYVDGDLKVFALVKIQLCGGDGAPLICDGYIILALKGANLLYITVTMRHYCFIGPPLMLQKTHHTLACLIQLYGHRGLYNTEINSQNNYLLEQSVSVHGIIILYLDHIGYRFAKTLV